MTLKDFWELNIKGNAEQQLKKLTAAGDRLTKSFQSSQKFADRFGPSVKRSATSISTLEDKLRRLKARQREAFDTKHIARYNRMIQTTERRIAKMNAMGLKGGSMGMMGMGGMGGMLKTAARYFMPLGIAGGLMMGAGSSFSKVMQFDKEMSSVRAITGANGADLDALRQTAMNVGGSTTFTASEAASGIKYLGMAGFDKNQAQTALPSVANLAMAGNVGLDRSADVLSNVLGQYELEAFRSADVANLMAATISSSNTNFEQMSEALKYLGPTMHSMNVSLDETASVVAALGDAGIQGSLAGRALGTSLVRLANPTEKMTKSMNTLGLKVYDANGEFIGMQGLLKQLEDGTRNLTAEQKAAHLQTIFGSEAYQEMSILLNKGSVDFANYTDSISGTNAAARMAKEMNDNLSGDIDKLNSAWESFILTIENGQGPLSRFFRTITQGLTDLITHDTVAERFDIPMISTQSKSYDELITQYTQLDKRLAEVTSLGGTAEEQVTRLNALKGEVSMGMYSQTYDDMDVKNKRFEMSKDLLDRIQGSINNIKQTEGKTVPAGRDQGTTSTPLLEAATESVNGGGRRVRNVVINIRALNEGGIHNHVSSPAEALQLSEDKQMDMLIRAVRGGEVTLMQGE